MSESVATISEISDFEIDGGDNQEKSGIGNKGIEVVIMRILLEVLMIKVIANRCVRIHDDCV